MKIVQSLWSKPGQQRNGQENGGTSHCGWPDKKYNYFSWALSALQFRKFYDEVELITDKAGYDLLINKLELPYTSAKVVLDDLNDYHPGLWAIGKFYAYSLQEVPFIHADGDVYIWRKFDADLENAGLLCQRKEEGKTYSRYYFEVFIQMVQHFLYYPEVLDKSINRHNSIKAINAGIIGGTNLHFFSQYAKMAFEFVDRNLSCLHKINIKRANQVFEQFLFRALSEEEEEPICYFDPAAHDLVDDYMDFTGVPAKTKFIHTPGAFKQARHTVDALAYRLQTDHPDCYYRIIRLLNTHQL